MKPSPKLPEANRLEPSRHDPLSSVKARLLSFRVRFAKERQPVESRHGQDDAKDFDRRLSAWKAAEDVDKKGGVWA